MGKSSHKIRKKKDVAKGGDDATSPSYDHPTSPAIFFFKDDEKSYGCICQWYRCSFTDPDSGLTFTSAEQWMMWNKGKMAGDEVIIREIMKTTSPRTHKRLGREAKGFDHKEWDRIKFDVVVRGNMMKFTQADDKEHHQNLVYTGIEGDEERAPRPLRDVLLGTGDKYLVEASPFDTVWGIGVCQARATDMARSKWGENLLGRALVVVRERLREETNALAAEAEGPVQTIG